MHWGVWLILDCSDYTQNVLFFMLLIDDHIIFVCANITIYMVGFGINVGLPVYSMWKRFFKWVQGKWNSIISLSSKVPCWVMAQNFSFIYLFFLGHQRNSDLQYVLRYYKFSHGQFLCGCDMNIFSISASQKKLFS